MRVARTPAHTRPLPGTPVIETINLSRTYTMGAVKVPALRRADLRVDAGEFVALMGASGSGKSTLLQLLGCLDTPTDGQYFLAGREVSALSADERARVRNRQIGFIFQSFNLLPRSSALDNVALPLLYRGRQPEVRKRALQTLERVGLAHRAGHAPNEMSGGERQRVAIARALVGEPDLFLADEPTGNLDSQTGAEIMQLLSTLATEGHTILMVTHDTGVAAYARRCLTMRDGILYEGRIQDDAD